MTANTAKNIRKVSLDSLIILASTRPANKNPIPIPEVNETSVIKKKLLTKLLPYKKQSVIEAQVIITPVSPNNNA